MVTVAADGGPDKDALVVTTCHWHHEVPDVARCMHYGTSIRLPISPSLPLPFPKSSPTFFCCVTLVAGHHHSFSFVLSTGWLLVSFHSFT